MLKRLNRYSRCQMRDHKRPGAVAATRWEFGSGALPDQLAHGQTDGSHAPGGRPLGSLRSTATVTGSAGWTEVVIPGGQELKSDLRNTAPMAVLVNTSLSAEVTPPVRASLLGVSGDTVNSGPFSCPSNHEVMI